MLGPTRLLFPIWIVLLLLLPACRRDCSDVSAELGVSRTREPATVRNKTVLICPGRSAFVHWQSTGGAVVRITTDISTDLEGLAETGSEEVTPSDDTRYTLRVAQDDEDTCLMQDEALIHVIRDGDPWTITMTANADVSEFSGGLNEMIADPDIVVMGIRVDSTDNHRCWSVTHGESNTTLSYDSQSAADGILLLPEESFFSIVGQYTAIPTRVDNENNTCDFATPVVFGSQRANFAVSLNLRPLACRQ